MHAPTTPSSRYARGGWGMACVGDTWHDYSCAADWCQVACHCGDMDMAVEAMGDMERSGVRADEQTYETLMAGAGHNVRTQTDAAVADFRSKRHAELPFLKLWNAVLLCMDIPTRQMTGVVL